MRPVAVDVVVLRDGKIVLIRRKEQPYKGFLALPGGFVKEHESVEEAAVREVKEETGLDVKISRLVGVFSKPTRDPRGTISIAFIGFGSGDIKPGDDAAEVVEVELDRISNINLAFDHKEIIETALKSGLGKD